MTTLKATEFVHIKWVNCVLCEFAQKSCFKIKVDPELKHLLNHFPSLPTEEVRGGRRGQSPLRRLKEDGLGAGSPGNHSNGVCPEKKGLWAPAVWGRRPKITKNLKLQGEVEGGVVTSNGELLMEGKEKFYCGGC